MPLEDTRASNIAALYSRHIDEIKRLLRPYLRNHSDVDDCAQEAFLKIWRQETLGQLEGDAKGYLFTTAINVVRDHWRRHRVRRENPHVSVSDDLDSERSIETETGIFLRDSLRVIEAELKNLDPVTRDAFLLHYAEHKSIKEISQQLGISTRSVDRELARALDHCRSVLGSTLKDLLG